MIVFACLTPHPPLILPHVGSLADRQKVKKTINSLKKLSLKLQKAQPDLIVISSPHPDWGFDVPLYFLTQNQKPTTIKPFLTDLASPQVHFKRGEDIIKTLPENKKIAWIASGDMSHRLKKDGPYGFDPNGPKFDQKFMSLLLKKDVPGILNLDTALIEQAGECGLRSFSMLLGALVSTESKWQPQILSYEGPFGVGYLVAQLL